MGFCFEGYDRTSTESIAYSVGSKFVMATNQTQSKSQKPAVFTGCVRRTLAYEIFYLENTAFAPRSGLDEADLPTILCR
jgi:hypothetical protein